MLSSRKPGTDIQESPDYVQSQPVRGETSDISSVQWVPTVCQV